ncbi:FPD1 benzoylformate decarboxylase [Colletotrichum tofieldiae]|uniref:FPD1 benzoylformate decarboxylase n=1 Tax=Colletotrichum tofieldiae TaxID=708197 RepID=A0A166YAR6_9PEZI|nr:FPD1 benzoylformate decarboxylase [Colletotrichum tofieldiae]GKT84382.1 FPD1 benzoylformate decarboxylase [Colletotrichum tofieldiae]
MNGLTAQPKQSPLQDLFDIITMLPTTIRSPPSLGEFTPIEEHQAQTPETFFGGKPVLHFHLEGAKAWIPASQKGNLAVFPADVATTASAPEGATLKEVSEELVEQQISVFVNSENFTIFSAAQGAGVEIPYPSISIHAVKQVGIMSEGTPLQAIWMQLQLADGGDGDDDFDTIDLTLVPAITAGVQADVQKFYDAISTCSDLHPDPVDEEDEEEDGRIVFEGEHEPVEGYTGVMYGAHDGGLPPAFPGSGGWITAENVHEHFDADGNWIGQNGGEEEEGGELGEGAGRVRGHDEVNDGVNGHDDPDNKRPRVDGS